MKQCSLSFWILLMLREGLLYLVEKRWLCRHCYLSLVTIIFYSFFHPVTWIEHGKWLRNSMFQPQINFSLPPLPELSKEWLIYYVSHWKNFSVSIRSYVLIFKIKIFGTSYTVSKRVSLKLSLLCNDCRLPVCLSWIIWQGFKTKALRTIFEYARRTL